uniref:SCRc n=1 Tax=Arabidopsis thaliana TaxID=3702 RepID=L7UWN7_ARATH|nr:SCRc [Arabidopsis thaliana]
MRCAIQYIVTYAIIFLVFSHVQDVEAQKIKECIVRDNSPGICGTDGEKVCEEALKAKQKKPFGCRCKYHLEREYRFCTCKSHQC